MNRRGIFSTAVGVALAAFAGMASVVALLAAPAPVVSFGFRGTSGEVLEVGEPLAVVVQLSAPEEARESITLAPANGSWTQSVVVELARVSGGAANPVRATPLGKSDAPHATLDHTRIAGGGWLFTSAATAGLVPGDYVVQVRVRIVDGTGWRGESLAYPRHLRVVVATANSVRRTLALAGEAMLTDRLEAAAKILDEFLKTKPKESAALVSRAIVAERAGNFMAASWYANQADSNAAIQGPPPLELVELRARLRAKLAEPANSAESPPAWSWPPKEMLEARFVETKKTFPIANAAAKPAPAAAAETTLPPPATVPRVASSTATPAGKPAQSNHGSAPAVSSIVKHGTPSAGGLVPAAEITEAKILADPAGQWAVSAVAGSQYGAPLYSPAQATGAPDIAKPGDSPKAWCHSGTSKAIEWLELTYAKPVHATEVRVRQTLNPGTIVKVEAIEADGTAHVWWEGKDPGLAAGAGTIAWFAVRGPKTDYAVARIKLTLDLSLRVGWKQIDAVQLVEAK